MYILTILVVIVSSIVHLNCDWIQIAQSSDRYDKRNDHPIGHSFLTSNIGTKHNFSEIKHADLFDVIGHETESDFRTGTNAFHRRNEKNKRLFFDVSHKHSNSSTDSPRSATLYYPNDKYIDPWAIYDRPITQNKPPVKISSLLEMNVTTEVVDSVVSSPASVFSSNVGNRSNKTLIFDHKTRLFVKQNGTRNSSTGRGPRKPTTAPKLVPTQLILKHVEFKPFDFSSILKFFSRIQNSFSLGGIARVRDKVNFLEDFRDKLLTNIGDRLLQLWPSTAKANNRERRSVSGSSHSIDFPSAEMALMTISFLTLAVFLIKLVLQVIHTIKSKHVGYGAMQSMVAQHSLGGLNLHSGGLANSGLSLLGGGASGLASHGNLGLTAGEALGGGGATGAYGGGNGMYGLVESLDTSDLSGGDLKFDDISGGGEPLIKIIKKSRQMTPATHKNIDEPPEIAGSSEGGGEMNR